MTLNSLSRLTVLVALAAVTALAVPNAADAQRPLKWKMQSAFASNLDHLGPSALRFSEKVESMSSGKFVIKFHEPGALVPALETFDAVSKGAIESAWTSPGYHAGRYPGLAFMTAVPFGPGMGEYMAWKWFGGGNEIRDKIYAQHDLLGFDCFGIGPETSGWFKFEVNSLEQLKGLKMRFFGLGAKVMTKIGVSTQLLAGADIYPALERGVIDATEFSMPTIDIKLGFYQIAKYNYFPGWHQQVSVSELLINKDEWNKLNEQQQTIIKVALGEQVMFTYAETEAKNFGAMGVMTKKHGVNIRRWPDSTLAEFEAAWNEVLKEESAKDPLFKKVSDHFYAFRKDYSVWGKAQTLKATYLK
jgi:TRAP-type mannitol/chloroaromatic compound transport system substrate-binding protein